MVHIAGGTFRQHVPTQRPLVDYAVDAIIDLLCDYRHDCNYMMQSLADPLASKIVSDSSQSCKTLKMATLRVGLHALQRMQPAAHYLLSAFESYPLLQMGAGGLPVLACNSIGPRKGGFLPRGDNWAGRLTAVGSGREMLSGKRAIEVRTLDGSLRTLLLLPEQNSGLVLKSRRCCVLIETQSVCQCLLLYPADKSLQEETMGMAHKPCVAHLQHVVKVPRLLKARSKLGLHSCVTTL